jgi:hypothetical protein
MQAIELLRRGITSLTGIATRLNQMKHPAPRGGQWSPAQVRAVIKRCEGDNSLDENCPYLRD